MSPPRKGKNTVSKIVKGKPSETQVLAKAVKKLQLKDKKSHQYLNYAQSESRVNMSADYVALNLCNYSAGTPIFGAAANDENDYKIIHQSFGLDCYLSLENTINNEPDTTTFTIFLVSLTDDIGNVFNITTGALTLTAGTHYYIQNGQCMISKKCFKIHKVMRKVLTNHGTALIAPSAQTQSGTDFRFYIKHSPRTTISNVGGDWKNLSSSVDPSKQYYLLIFNDNSVLDLQSPALTYNLVRTMKTIV